MNPTSPTRRAILALGAAVIACMLLAACSSPAEKPAEKSAGSNKSNTGGTPSFSGPWAEEFRSAYQKAPNTQVREYLSDGAISDAEKQAVTEEFRTCLAAQGLIFDDFKNDGSYEVKFANGIAADQANTTADDCSQSTGVDTVIGLYVQLRANPENADMTAAIAECLVRSGAVPPNFTAAEYKSAPITDFAVGDEAKAIQAAQDCQSDPNGAFRG